MLDAVKAFQRGAEPPHLVTDPELNDFRHAESSFDVIEGRDWRARGPHLVMSASEAVERAEPASMSNRR